MKKNIRAALLALPLLAPAIYAQDSADARLDPRTDYTVNNWQSLTARDAARQDAKEPRGAEPDQACAQFRISDDMNARAGRIGLSAFMSAPHRNPGDTNTLQRPMVIVRTADQAYAEAP
jgi:hypothetical protein